MVVNSEAVAEGDVTVSWMLDRTEKFSD